MNAHNDTSDGSIVISINGRIVPVGQASLTVLDSAVLSGYGVFETMLASDAHLYREKEHLERLGRSCEALGLSHHFTRCQIAEALSVTLKEYNTQDTDRRRKDATRFRRVRITLTGGNPGDGLWGTEALAGSLIVFVQGHRLPDDSAVISAEVVDSATALHWLSGHKTLSRMTLAYPIPPAGRKEPNAFQILYNSSCGITEFNFASLFVRKGEMVLTAPDTHLFPGICRSEILGSWPAIAPEFMLEVRRIEIADLLDADEVIGVNSLRAAFALSRLSVNINNTSASATYEAPVLRDKLRRFLLAR